MSGQFRTLAMFCLYVCKSGICMFLYRVLLSLLFPGHTIFVFIIFTVKILDLPSPLFLIFYLVAAVIQVFFRQKRLRCKKSDLYAFPPSGGSPVVHVSNPGVLDVEEGSRPRQCCHSLPHCGTIKYPVLHKLFLPFLTSLSLFRLEIF